MIHTALAVLNLIALTWNLATLIRLSLAIRYEVRLQDRVEALAWADLKANYPAVWRYAGLRQSTLFSMVYQFWRPFASFYPDQSFLDANIHSLGNRTDHAPLQP